MSLISVLRKKNKKELFTTPSHDGKLCIFHKFYQWYRNDISETDSYNPQEALKKAEERAAEIYGVNSTHFLTNGSTSGIHAAVLASCKQGEKLLIWDKAHPSHKNAGILAGANIVEYELPYNKDWGIYEKLSPKEFEDLISKNKPKAVIVASPTYEGIVSDTETFAKICKTYGVILIVDEAHGALYPFSKDLPKSAVKYADFTIQSLHKTAGGINPTALLHSNSDLDIEHALNLISTTSPSYPMLATIEANINFLNSKRGKKKIEELIANIKNIKEKLKNLDFYGDDITKVLIKKQGLSGYELSERLYNKFNIEDERTNEKSTLLLTGIGTTREKLKKLEKLVKI
ncbi:aminotransferase class I/II-fold pyridoxal phosphate-dependent enzyme [bacterium]|nr:aminotransferase class I/II-fold pyridoxal phosphate-dependent enzyme [bacterium]